MANLTSSRSGSFTVEFRRTARDNQPPSHVLTSHLMGDPTPDREARSEELRKSLVKPARGDQGVPRHDAKVKRGAAIRQ